MVLANITGEICISVTYIIVYSKKAHSLHYFSDYYLHSILWDIGIAIEKTTKLSENTTGWILVRPSGAQKNPATSPPR